MLTYRLPYHTSQCKQLSISIFKKESISFLSPQRTIDLPNAGGEEVHETVHGLLAGHHAVDVVPVQHAQLTGQPGWVETILRNNIEKTEQKMWFPPPTFEKNSLLK